MTTTDQPTLWHFTCEHAYRSLGNGGVLKPNRHPLMPELGNVIWLTEESWPERDAVGLTSDYISCDRMAYRYRIVDSDARPWGAYRHLVLTTVRMDLEAYAQPHTWWLATWAEAVAS
jgi:hypothetical protein